MKDYQFLSSKYLIPAYANRGLNLVSGHDCYLVDENGIEYLDMMSNYGASIFGFGHPAIIGVLTKQLNTLITLHGSFINDVRSEASLKLIKRVGEPYKQIYWSNSGAEAIEAALKFAVVAAKKKKIIAAHNSFHGKTLGALSATGVTKYRINFEPLLWEFVFHKYGNSYDLKSLIDKDTAAVIIEPIQGEGGIIFPPESYLNEVRILCDKNNLILILDEIQTGMGRTGSFLASTVNADIFCLGKGLAGGLPVGATVVTEKVAQSLSKGMHSTTFGGSPFVCSAVCAVLDLLTDKQLLHISETGDYFLSELQQLSSSHIIDVRGKGLMIGLEVNENRNEILRQLQKNKILAIPAGESVVRFLPPYIITKKEVDSVVGALKTIIK